MDEIKMIEFDPFSQKHLYVGFKQDMNSTQVKFKTEGDNNFLLLMTDVNEYMPIPIPTNEWVVGLQTTQEARTMYGQILKLTEGKFAQHSPLFSVTIQPSIPIEGQQQIVPPNFELKYNEMVAVINKINDMLETGAFDGLSAYEVAVKNGFVGTEQEWLDSLKSDGIKGNIREFITFDEKGKQVARKIEKEDLPSDIGSGVEKNYVDEQDTKTLTDAKAYTDKQKEKLENLIVTTTSNPLGGYVCDYSSDEIRNALIQNKTVVMYFEDTVEQSGNQVYPFLKMTQDGAYFRRLQVDRRKSMVRQIDIKVDYSKKVTFEESKINVATNDELTELSNVLQDLDHDKLGIKRVAVASDVVSQSEASDIISNYGNYEGSYIEFLTNGDMPNKTIGYGYLVTDKTGNQFLIVYNLDGTITQFNKSSYEKHMIECRSYVNEMVDLDNFTVDKQGDAPFYASVNDAINRPFRSETSKSGIVFVMPFKIDKQVQIYYDVENQKSYTRYVTGTDGQHSFRQWVKNYNENLMIIFKNRRIIYDGKTFQEVNLSDFLEAEVSSYDSSYTLPVAKQEGTNLLFAKGGGGGSYTLPVASDSTLGGVKVAPYDETFTQPVSLNPLTEMLMVKEQAGGSGGNSNVAYIEKTLTQVEQIDHIVIPFEGIRLKDVFEIQISISNPNDDSQITVSDKYCGRCAQSTYNFFSFKILKVNDICWGIASRVTLYSRGSFENYIFNLAIGDRPLDVGLYGIVKNNTINVRVLYVKE